MMPPQKSWLHGAARKSHAQAWPAWPPPRPVARWKLIRSSPDQPRPLQLLILGHRKAQLICFSSPKDREAKGNRDHCARSSRARDAGQAAKFSGTGVESSNRPGRATFQ